MTLQYKHYNSHFLNDILLLGNISRLLHYLYFLQ
nr:MAG TPA: hypothetical protein [Caudoviricetes sp.]